MIGVLLFLIKAAAVLLIAFLALGWLQNFHPAFDSFSHFRLIGCAALGALGLLFAATTAWNWAATSAAAVVISLALSYPYLPGFGPAETASDNSQKSIGILQFNLLFNNDDIDAMASAILSQKADVVLMQELTPLNFSLLDQLKERFPYQLECNSKSNGSVALVSRHPFAKLGSQNCLRKLGFIHAELVIDERVFTVAGFHSKWPWPQRQFHQITALEQTIRAMKTPLILAGDFNAAPWSAAVQRVATLSGTKVVEGVLLSWKPRIKGLSAKSPLLMPLDQIMASNEFIPVARRRVQDGGSDHLPVLTEFKWSKED